MSLREDVGGGKQSLTAFNGIIEAHHVCWLAVAGAVNVPTPGVVSF